MAKLFWWIVLLWIGFAWGIYVSYNNLEDILLGSMNSVIDDTINVVSIQVQESFDESWVKADASVDAYIADQKMAIAAKLEAEKQKLKDKLKANIETYISEKVNFIFGTSAE